MPDTAPDPVLTVRDVMQTAVPTVERTAHVAARLQAAAPVGGVLVGERTRELVGDDAPLAPTPELRVKGKARPVEAYLLTLPVPRPASRSGAGGMPSRRSR